MLIIFQSAVHVLWRKLWKRKMSNFSGIGPVYELYRLKSLITLEQVNTLLVEKNTNLYEKNFGGEANQSVKIMTRHVHHVLTLWQWCNFSRIEAIDFRVFFTHNQSIQKKIVEYDIKSKYPEEYSTVDKVGREYLKRGNHVSCSEPVCCKGEEFKNKGI